MHRGVDETPYIGNVASQNCPQWALFGLDLKLPKTLRKRVYNHNRVFLCKKGLKRQLKLKKWQGHVVKSGKNWLNCKSAKKKTNCESIDKSEYLYAKKARLEKISTFQICPDF